MAYQLSQDSFFKYLEALSATYKVFAPIKQASKGHFADTDLVTNGPISSAKDIIWDQKSYFSPKEIFYPIRETLFKFVDGQVFVPEIDPQPILILLRPCDLNGINRLDQIFLQNGDLKDYYYERRRALVKFAVIECTTGFDSCFCVSMGSNTVSDYDLAIRKTEDGFVIDPVGETLMTPDLAGLEGMDFRLSYVEENKVKVDIPDFEGVALETVFNHPMWQEYSRRCIACGRCNTSCITCSCFTMQDVTFDADKALSERRRRWAGCHVKGFTDMAGGHRFREKNGERMRFKLMHKVNDYHRRFGDHMCVGCGRCDDVCPEYISFPKAIEKVNAIIKEVKS